MDRPHDYPRVKSGGISARIGQRPSARRRRPLQRPSFVVCEVGAPLPGEVGEGFVGIGHAMHVLASADGGALTVVGIEQF